MENKKISTILLIAVFVCAIIALIGFADTAFGISGNGFTTFDYMFNRVDRIGSNFTTHYRAIYIVSFTLLLITIASIGIMLFLQITGNGKAQYNKYVLVGAIGSFVIIAVFAFCCKAVILGEMCANGYALDEAKEYVKEIGMGRGVLCQAIFSLIATGCLSATLLIQHNN